VKMYFLLETSIDIENTVLSIKKCYKHIFLAMPMVTLNAAIHDKSCFILEEEDENMLSLDVTSKQPPVNMSGTHVLHKKQP
jgi:hypothetical protein